MSTFHIIYKNHFGDFNILVTKTIDGSIKKFSSVASTQEVFDAHIWINDNIVKKNHTGKNILPLDSTVTDKELKELLKSNI